MEEVKPCPFCGKKSDLYDDDTLYPTGIGWKFDADLQTRTYCKFREVPKEQWCWTMHCPEVAGGCGAGISGDSREEAIAKWNARAPTHHQSAEPEPVPSPADCPPVAADGK